MGCFFLFGSYREKGEDALKALHCGGKKAKRLRLFEAHFLKSKKHES